MSYGKIIEASDRISDSRYPTCAKSTNILTTATCLAAAFNIAMKSTVCNNEKLLVGLGTRLYNITHIIIILLLYRTT